MRHLLSIGVALVALGYPTAIRATPLYAVYQDSSITDPSTSVVSGAFPLQGNDG